jgi:hypothetical protein
LISSYQIKIINTRKNILTGYYTASIFVSGWDTFKRRDNMNTTLFKSHMAKNNDTQTILADVMSLAQSAISARINGKIEFRQNEINFIRRRWSLSDQETVDIFFDDEVSKTDTNQKGA